MRHLYAGNGHRGARPARKKSESNRVRNSQWTGGKSLSLHRLYEDFRVSSAGVSEMRSFVPSYELISTGSLAEALEALTQSNDGWKPFAGGTDLMVLLEAGKLLHRNYVNIWNL